MTNTSDIASTPAPRIGAVVVARMKSSRLPGKSMAMIEGRPALEWLIRRLRRSRHTREIVVATTTDAADDVIAALAERLGQRCFRGSEEDVLGRVYGAAKAGGFDVIVHVTGDCPLIDARLVDRCVRELLAGAADYVRVDPDAYPPGMDVEVFGTTRLGELDSSFHDPWVREHVTVPFYTMPERFRERRIPAPPELHRPHYRICLDTPQDLALIQEIFAHLLPRGEDFGAGEIVRLLDARPELTALNAGITEAKYPCAVIGLGAVGSLYQRQPFAAGRTVTHAGAYRRYGKTRLLAGCDPDEARRANFVADWQINRVYPTAAEMFAGEDVAIVSIATPPETHAALCLEAVEAGVKAILCEKPFVLDVGEGRRVLDACERNGVLLSVNCCRRWSGLYQGLRGFLNSSGRGARGRRGQAPRRAALPTLRALARSEPVPLCQGGLGEVQSVRVHYAKGLRNSGSHAIDLLRFLFGDLDSVVATETLGADREDPDIGGVLRMRSGLPVHLTVSDHRAHFRFELDVIGTAGRIVAANDEVAFWQAAPCESEPGVNTLRPAAVPFPTELGTPFEDAVAELVNHLEHGTGQTTCCGSDGLAAVRAVQALEHSWANGGKRISLDVEDETDPNRGPETTPLCGVC